MPRLHLTGELRQQSLQRLRVSWLGKVVVESRLAGSLTVLGLAPTGQGDEVGVGCFGAPTKLSRNFQAVHLRQSQVEQNDVRTERASNRHGATAIERLSHVVAAYLERGGKHLDQIRIVVDHQYS